MPEAAIPIGANKSLHPNLKESVRNKMSIGELYHT